jgi:hypothetical protein
MTLWELVTGNSSLPVQAGVTFWDHLTHQTGGTGANVPLPVFYREISIEEITPVEMILTSEVNELTLVNAGMTEIVIDENEFDLGEY